MSELLSDDDRELASTLARRWTEDPLARVAGWRVQACAVGMMVGAMLDSGPASLGGEALRALREGVRTFRRMVGP